MTKFIFIKVPILLLKVLLTGILVLGALLWAHCPDKFKPYIDQSGNEILGSISEKTFITINGVKQGMFIKSKDESHPVLLFHHDGMSEYFLGRRQPTSPEHYLPLFCALALKEENEKLT